MTRTSSISGTFVKRQRSPVRVAAASSFRAAFFEPLIGTSPSADAALDPEDLAGHRLGRDSQWKGFASAIGDASAGSSPRFAARLH
jgi:hypothetical protein